MSEVKNNIIGMLFEKSNIKSVKDIEDVLKGISCNMYYRRFRVVCKIAIQKMFLIRSVGKILLNIAPRLNTHDQCS